MTYTLRHVSREVHYPATERLLKPEPNQGLGSIKKAAQEAAKRKVQEDATKAEATESESSKQPM